MAFTLGVGSKMSFFILLILIYTKCVDFNPHSMCLAFVKANLCVIL
jgi:hypothetical protein